jgi:hypothetical protein
MMRGLMPQQGDKGGLVGAWHLLMHNLLLFLDAGLLCNLDPWDKEQCRGSCCLSGAYGHNGGACITNLTARGRM